MTATQCPGSRVLVAAIAMWTAASGARGTSIAQSTEQPPAEKSTESVNLITNGSFEDGKDWPSTWRKGRAIEGVKYLWDRDAGHEGKSSVCIKKVAQRYFPIADWSQTVPHSGKTTKLKVSVWVKAQDAHKSIVDVGFNSVDGSSTHQWAVYIGAKGKDDQAATHDWTLYEGVVAVPPKTKDLVIGLQTYGPGTTWFDDVKAEYVADSTPETKFGEDAKPKAGK